MTTREVEHHIDVDAPAAQVYRMIAEVENWPLLFPPSVHVDYVERGESAELIRIWATANGEAKSWTSRRELDPAARRITFRQQRSTPPVAAMGGTWIIEETGPGSARVRLLHDYRAVDDDPAGLQWIDEAVDRNSRSELAALKSTVEDAANRAELILSFTDSVEVDAAAADLYDFVNEAQHWSDRLPHVAAVDLREDTPGLQVLRMDTLTKDGGQHTTESVRVCFPHRRIAYKQTLLPALMSLHTGQWDFTDNGAGGTTASSQHTVVVNTDNLARVLGADATVDDARQFLREALGRNSRATLGHAAEYARARR
ncbi:aromatase/cyclase [Actinokineospora diospyrosa]|uniref:Aromatase n=1 Tax=Actinokineospora diospyrosa TaxID=103728 RepID=A0ABT1IE52_9PSEU|nr:aromatase/cyclase [Actinokineospora diospyrosa]MCP2270816.1 aromatase [Actinokineospora diospyrosa]